MNPRFDYGETVCVVRTVRNDGTYPGTETGEVLARVGSVGRVRNVGTFLQDRIIDAGHVTLVDRIVGCREEEPIGAGDPWVETRFPTCDHVSDLFPRVISGQVVVPAGQGGEVILVLRDDPGRPAYHVHFGGRVFRVPESALVEASPSAEAAVPAEAPGQVVGDG